MNLIEMLINAFILIVLFKNYLISETISERDKIMQFALKMPVYLYYLMLLIIKKISL